MLGKYGLVKSDFGPYSKLEAVLSNPKTTEENVNHLELRKQKARIIPPPKILSILTSLKSIDLSHNLLSEMRMGDFSRAVPNLESLNLDHNRITSLIDIEKLGSLKFLKELSFLDNPVTQYSKFMQILNQLMFPPSKNKPTAVEIFTATYKFVPNLQEKNLKINVTENNLVYVDELMGEGILKYSPEGGSNGRLFTGRKEKNWMVLLKEKPCPTRKIGDF